MSAILPIILTIILNAYSHVHVQDQRLASHELWVQPITFMHLQYKYNSFR